MDSIQQQALLIIAEIKSVHQEVLEDLFSRMVDEQDIENNQWVPFGELKTVHFARWAILPAASDSRGHPIPAQLLFASNYDGPQEAHLAELVKVAVSGIDEIYQHCEGYPEQPSADERLAYLRERHVNHSAFYVGTVGRGMEQIHLESELRDAIQDFADSRDWADTSPVDIRTAIQHFVFEQNKVRFAWAQTPPKPRLRPWTRFVKGNFKKISIGFAVLVGALLVLDLIPWWALGAFLGGLLFLLVLFAAILRYKEKRDHQDSPDYFCPDVSKLTDREDLGVVQNQMTSILNIKPGWFRLMTLRVVQKLVNFIAHYFENEGSLLRIPSIHFARWAIVDDQRRLLFLSNFDGSWENYLDDFIDKAAYGLTAVWTNTVGFPKTQWMFLKGGARDEKRFKAYARKSQVPTQVWYSAYKTLTVQNINNNSMIRAGLYGELSDAEIKEWLHRL